MALAEFRKTPAYLSPYLCQLTAFEEQSFTKWAQPAPRKEFSKDKKCHQSKLPIPALDFQLWKSPRLPPSHTLVFLLHKASIWSITCTEQLQHKGFFFLSPTLTLSSGKSRGKPLLVTNQNTPSPLGELSWCMHTVQQCTAGEHHHQQAVVTCLLISHTHILQTGVSVTQSWFLTRRQREVKLRSQQRCSRVHVLPS